MAVSRTDELLGGRRGVIRWFSNDAFDGITVEFL